MVGYTRRARLPRDRLMLTSRRRCRRRQRWRTEWPVLCDL